MNILSLAYLGDSVYEVYIRSYLVSLGLKVDSSELKKKMDEVEEH